jgi:uncharacterized membrane protein
MQNKQRTQRLTLAAFFVAIEIVLALTPLGYIPVGAISITTMHIPVILAGILMGPSYGALIGFVFGMTSMLRATFSPNITSFCFSPFITVGGVHGNFASLLIAFGPRIFLGWFAGILYRFLMKHFHKEALAASFSAGLNTLFHTLLVMGLIGVFFGDAYASAAGIAVTAVIVTVLASNGILEIVLAAVVVPAVNRALKPAKERMGLSEWENSHA